MYIADLKIELVSPPSYDPFCQVRATWVYGNQRPHVIEFWWVSPSDSVADQAKWQPCHQSVLADKNAATQEHILTVPATILTIIVCPRLEEAGVYLPEQKDEEGTYSRFSHFCLYYRINPQRLSARPDPKCVTPPEITGLDVDWGSIIVRWNNPEGFDEFELEVRQDDLGLPPSYHRTEEQWFRVGRLAAGDKFVSVKGIHNNALWLPGCDSPWSNVHGVTLPAELAYVVPQFPPGAPLAAMSRHEKHQEVMVCATDSRPMGIWKLMPHWEWEAWFRHATGPGFPAGTPLAALSRDRDFMDAFAAGQNGCVNHALWHHNPWIEWLQHSDPRFPPPTHIAALARSSDHMDIFCVDDIETLRWRWWNGGPWPLWEDIGGLKFPPGAPIAAISRYEDQMDIFCVCDQIVFGNWWNGPPWRGWYQVEGALFPLGATIAAVSRNDDQMDLFAIDMEGNARTNWWNRPPWRGWDYLGGAEFPPGAPIVAISNSEDWMHVLAIDKNGIALLNVWNGGWSGWQEVPDAKFPPGAHVAATYYETFFCVADDGYLKGTSSGIGWKWMAVE